MSSKVADYNRTAATYLQHPPDPRFSVLAIAWYQKALQIEPENLETHLALAKAYHQLGRVEDALRCCTKAIKLDPNSLVARYYRCMLQLPILYRCEAEILRSRQQYHQQLLALQEQIKNATPQALNALAEVIGAVSPFYLIYQGYNDVELQRLYGEIITQVMAARYPQWADAPQRIPPKPAEPIRVGIVFGHFHQHSVWKVIVKGWIGQLDRERFQLFGYALGERRDQETAIARASLHKFVAGPHSIEEWGQRINADRPHILLYPEVSMNRVAIQLSALRLAPIQCTTWGTYITSGLLTMDYSLSGELFEPDNAAEQYTETLVQLPDLSIYYTPPQVTLAPLQREAYGLRPSAVVYFCAQSLFKYPPQHDEIYPRIAQAVGDCHFVFMKHKSSEALTKMFVQRLQRAFTAAGLEMEHYVVMQPALSDAAYHRLNDLADVFLDSIGVAGTTTTLEATHYNLPIVTIPSPFLRGRVSSGVLQAIEVTETIAADVEQYVEIAIRLGKETEWRQHVRKRMAANKDRIYHNRACIERLETFFDSVVRDERAS